MDFAIDVHQAEDHLIVVAVRGDVDVATAAILRREIRHVEDRLRAAEDGKPRKVVLDLEKVSFMDSTGLSALVGAASRLRAEGAELLLARLSPPVERLLDVTRLRGKLKVLAEPDASIGRTNGAAVGRRSRATAKRRA